MLRLNSQVEIHAVFNEKYSGGSCPVWAVWQGKEENFTMRRTICLFLSRSCENFAGGGGQLFSRLSEPSACLDFADTPAFSCLVAPLKNFLMSQKRMAYYPRPRRLLSRKKSFDLPRVSLFAHFPLTFSQLRHDSPRLRKRSAECLFHLFQYVRIK